MDAEKSPCSDSLFFGRGRHHLHFSSLYAPVSIRRKKNYGAAISSSGGNVAGSMYTPKNDMTMPSSYPFTFSGMKLEFTYIKDINKLSFTCSSILDVDCLVVKDNEVLLEFDKTNNSCLLENKKRHEIKWEYNKDEISENGSFIINNEGPSSPQLS